MSRNLKAQIVLMDRVNLITLLDVLRDMRHKMLEEFNNQNTMDIYEPSFEYEDFPREMSLSIEKYFILWLDSHYNEFSTKIHTQTMQGRRPQDVETLKTDFFAIQHNLVSLFIDSSFGSDFSQELLEIKKFELLGFLKVSNQHQKKFSYLQYQQKKHSSLFRREINKIKKDRLSNKSEE